MTKAQRRQNLMPDGIPRYIRCYDNGGTEQGGSIDRYTVVFTGRYSTRGSKRNTDRTSNFIHLAMNAAPFHPQGFGQHGESDHPIDRPQYRHLGKKIRFEDLPEDCKTLVLQDYKEIWGLQDNGQ